MFPLVRRTVPSFRSGCEATEPIFGSNDRNRWCRYCSITAVPSKRLKVALIGAAGITGKVLALSLKQSSMIDELAIYDTRPTKGLISELNHINAKCKTIFYTTEHPNNTWKGTRIEWTLQDANIVVVSPEAKNLVQESSHMKRLVPNIAKHCPEAFVALLSRSANSLVPLTLELLKKYGVFEQSRIFGVANLYSVRANTFASRIIGISPEFVSVPIIGGCCTKTCIPVFSQTRPCAGFTTTELFKLTESMKNADDYLTEANREYNTYMVEPEPSCLAMGFAAARFCISLCKAIRAEQMVRECAYVRCCLIPELKYMVAPLELGPNGIQRYLGLPKLINSECEALYAAVPEIQKAIALGESLALDSRASTEICPVPSRCTALQLYAAKPST